MVPLTPALVVVLVRETHHNQCSLLPLDSSASGFQTKSDFSMQFQESLNLYLASSNPSDGKMYSHFSSLSGSSFLIPCFVSPGM